MGAAQATDTPDRTVPTPSPRWGRPAGGPPAPTALPGTREEIAAQMSRRSGHFMPLSLLDSQLATLEPLEPDENGIVVSAF